LLRLSQEWRREQAGHPGTDECPAGDHRITSSARGSIDCGIVTPMAVALLRLTASPATAPKMRMTSTYCPAPEYTDAPRARGLLRKLVRMVAGKLQPMSSMNLFPFITGLLRLAPLSQIVALSLRERTAAVQWRAPHPPLPRRRAIECATDFEGTHGERTVAKHRA
jgi:hypothetical protein